jgi:dTDP-glucose 4,6-dehydratase
MLITYAANPKSLAGIAHHQRYAFERVDICDRVAMARIFDQYQSDAVFHLAAKSHVDRSTTDAAAFIYTNVLGTYTSLSKQRDNIGRRCPSISVQGFG